MNPTQQMVSAFTQAVWLDDSPATYRELDSDEIKAGLAAALKDVPDVEPYTFTGFPNLIAYIHPPCSKVMDVDPAHAGVKWSLYEQVAAGECDCENASPWLRIYVEREA